jgi:hypothetical protein
MCYGDPWYGRDGYYLKWLEDQDQNEQEAMMSMPHNAIQVTCQGDQVIIHKDSDVSKMILSFAEAERLRSLLEGVRKQPDPDQGTATH